LQQCHFGVGALMALTKSKKHFIGTTWDDAGNKGGAASQVDESDYRGLLAGLEGLTGKRAVNFPGTMTFDINTGLDKLIIVLGNRSISQFAELHSHLIREIFACLWPKKRKRFRPGPNR
jgi:hypothetical protein